jgi:hypothetical protein
MIDTIETTMQREGQQYHQLQDKLDDLNFELEMLTGDKNA